MSPELARQRWIVISTPHITFTAEKKKVPLSCVVSIYDWLSPNIKKKRNSFPVIILYVAIVGFNHNVLEVAFDCPPL